MFIKILFLIKLHSGFIIADIDVDGTPLYTIPSIQVEYAYKTEVLRYLKTGVFQYDDTLDDPVINLSKNSRVLCYLTKNLCTGPS
jgi:hypothetical protein